MRRAALVTLAILAIPTAVQARPYPPLPPDPPEALYLEAWRRASALPPSDALCKTRLPKRYMQALHNRCIRLTAGRTAQNCGVEASCQHTLEELRAWCPPAVPDTIPCSDASLGGAQ